MRATEISTDQSDFSEREKLGYPMLRQLLAIKGPETHFKDFMATFLSSRFGAKTGFPASGDSNVSCYTFAVICAFSNYFKTNSVWYFRIKCKEDVKTVLISIMYLFVLT